MDHQVTEKQARNAIREAYNRTQKGKLPASTHNRSNEAQDYTSFQLVARIGAGSAAKTPTITAWAKI